ncbi:Exopolyphosphatase [Coemansia sp. RSA 2618]|nr:Exopolyphosphatase [Coemansia sp. RSA 2618]
MNAFALFVKTLAANTARLNNLEAHSGAVTLVLGNESADLDSMVSSLALAFALWTPQQAVPPIPVINTNRTDMALRPECALLLETTLQQAGGRGVADLTFIDDFDLLRVVQQGGGGGLDVWLADHNAPSSRQHVLEPFVRGIVDHHADEGRCMGATTRQIEPVGSCATLVAARLRELSDRVASPELAKLLIAPILVDTSDLSPAARRATDKDVAMVSWLVPQVEWVHPAAITGSADNDDDEPVSLDVSSTRELYKTLDRLKGNVSHLPARDLLRKDYKQWTVSSGDAHPWAVGISSVSYRLRKWVKRDTRAGIERALGEWVSAQQLDVALVMTHGKAKPAKGAPKTYGRDLTVAFAPAIDPERRQMVLDGLRQSDALRLEPFFGSLEQTDAPAFFFDQTRTESSRKQVFPTVKSVIESISP